MKHAGTGLDPPSTTCIKRYRRFEGDVDRGIRACPGPATWVHGTRVSKPWARVHFGYTQHPGVPGSRVMSRTYLGPMLTAVDSKSHAKVLERSASPFWMRLRADHRGRLDEISDRDADKPSRDVEFFVTARVVRFATPPGRGCKPYSPA